MSIDCACGIPDYGNCCWFYEPNDELKPLDTKRGRRCASCKNMIQVGEPAARMWRWRPPSSDIEESIHGDEVPLAPWYHCEECAELSKFINGMGWCYTLGDNLEQELETATKDGFNSPE